MNDTANDAGKLPSVAEPKFAIVAWFNEKPIRAIGTALTPYFYANDIVLALGVKNVYSLINKFDEFDLLSDADRLAEGIVTYRMYDGDWHRDDSVKLLREAGVYRLMLMWNTKEARKLRHHITDTIRDARLDKQMEILTLAKMKYEILAHKHAEDKQKLSEINANNPTIHVFECRVTSGRRQNGTQSSVVSGDDGKKLYKFTTHPNAHNTDMFIPCAKIFGNSSDIMGMLYEDSRTTPKAKFVHYEAYSLDEICNLISKMYRFTIVINDGNSEYTQEYNPTG